MPNGSAIASRTTRNGPPAWDKRFGVWRVAEDDPDSSLYAESSDVDTVISYITEHSIVDR
jgi:hypothetical protein